MEKLTYHERIEAASGMQVPDRTSFHFASARIGRLVSSDWNILMAFYSQLDNDKTPTELRTRIRESAQAFLHWAESGGAIGPVATSERVKKLAFGSPGLFQVDIDGQDTQDWTEPPFNTPSFDYLVDLLHDFKAQDPEGFRRNGIEFLRWLEEKRAELG